MSHILVVDDEPSMRITLEANLELAGMKVTVATDGQHALSLLKQQRFDLLLSDIRMPGMNGVELLRAVRQLSNDVPVVLMTAYALESLMGEAINEGAYTILSKPFDIERLTSVLLRAVRRPAVLVVHGTEDTGKKVVEALTAIGVRARAVSDRASATAALADDSTDICVMELCVAAEGEPPLIDQLRAIDSTLSFIAMVGDESPAMLRKVCAGGTIDCVRKPAPPKTLMASISAVRSRPPKA